MTLQLVVLLEDSLEEEMVVVDSVPVEVVVDSLVFSLIQFLLVMQ